MERSKAGTRTIEVLNKCLPAPRVSVERLVSLPISRGKVSCFLTWGSKKATEIFHIQNGELRISAEILDIQNGEPGISIEILGTQNGGPRISIGILDMQAGNSKISIKILDTQFGNSRNPVGIFDLPNGASRNWVGTPNHLLRRFGLSPVICHALTAGATIRVGFALPFGPPL